MNARENLEKLKGLLYNTNQASRIAARLEWDQQTQTPPGGLDAVSLQKSFMERQAYQFFVTDEIYDTLLELLSQENELEEAERLLVKRLLYSFNMAKLLSPEFVEKKSLITSAANKAWGKAKDASDFSIFASHLGEVFKITREEALRLGGKEGDGDSLYTALLGSYEPGMTTQRLREILSGVRQWLGVFIQKIMESPVKPADEQLADKILRGIFPENKQRSLSEALLRTIGYDFNCGNVALTRHPFTITVGKGDQRVTTHFLENFLSAGFFGTFHEGGHSLFAYGTHPLFDWADSTSFRVSMGIHESQSRLWENMVGRGAAFWLYFYPVLQAIFPQFYGIKLDDFMLAINVVRPQQSIRIYTDEVTYNLHILVRFEIEAALLSGDLKVEDLPAAFNQKMKEYLGHEPKNLAEGCLQDVHFSVGYIGYFPTYSLGNLAAAQLFTKFDEVCPEWSNDFIHGKFSTLLEWLRKEVHPLGFFETMDGLLVRVTGEPLNPGYWFQYIEDKFCPIYKIDPV